MSPPLPFDLPLRKQGIVLPVGAPDAWDGGMVESPTVWMDAPGRYGMVYTGYDLRHPGMKGYGSVGRPRIGLAWSTDLRNWSKDPRNPILAGSTMPGAPDSHGTAGPLVWKQDGVYYLYYFGTTAEGYEAGRKTLNLATSTNLTDWTRHPSNPVLEPQGTGWCRDAIWHPNIVEKAGRFYLFVNASGIVDGIEEEYIGVVVSDDLVDWRLPEPSGPLLVGSRQPGQWDARGRTGDPSVFKRDGVWFMAYYSWDGVSTRDGLAWTSEDAFPYGWQPFDENPILDIGPSGSFDALHAGKPFVVWSDAGVYHHFYTAVAGDETRQVALALGGRAAHPLNSSKALAR